MNEQLLKDAQFRKGLSIAFFNATNAAVELCKNMNPYEEATMKQVVKVRDFFLEEHKNYYAAVIAKVGLNYNVEEAVKKLKAAKTIAQLKDAWLMFSEDERHDPEVIKVAQAMKKSHEKAPANRTGNAGVAPKA